MNKSPAYQRYPDKWLADTRRLSWATKGIYADLLETIWLHFQESCAIPDDDNYISSEIGCTVDEWVKAKAELMHPARPLLQVVAKNNQETNRFPSSETNWLCSNGLWKERCKQLERWEKLRENGRKGGRPRNQLDTPDRKAPESLVSPTPTPTPTPDQEEDRGGPAQKQPTPRIELNRSSWNWENISEADRRAWSVAYPAVSLDSELAAAAQWCRTAGNKGYKSRYDRFLTGWLKRAQDRGGGNGSKPAARTPNAHKLQVWTPNGTE